MKKSLGAKTLVSPTPAWLVGSYDSNGKPNIMTVAWGGFCSSEPPSISISVYPEHHSFQSILERKAFTVSVPSVDLAREVDFAGLTSGADLDKFAVAGLTAIRAEHVDAPFVAEAPVVVECRLSRSVEVGVQTILIGEIVDVKAEEDVLGANGLPDILKVRPLIYEPGNGRYVSIGDIVGKGFSIGRELVK